MERLVLPPRPESCAISFVGTTSWFLEAVSTCGFGQSVCVGGVIDGGLEFGVGVVVRTAVRTFQSSEVRYLIYFVSNFIFAVCLCCGEDVQGPLLTSS